MDEVPHVQPTLDEITNKVFEELLVGKSRNKYQYSEGSCKVSKTVSEARKYAIFCYVAVYILNVTFIFYYSLMINAPKDLLYCLANSFYEIRQFTERRR